MQVLLWSIHSDYLLLDDLLSTYIHGHHATIVGHAFTQWLRPPSLTTQHVHFNIGHYFGGLGMILVMPCRARLTQDLLVHIAHVVRERPLQLMGILVQIVNHVFIERLILTQGSLVRPMMWIILMQLAQGGIRSVHLVAEIVCKSGLQVVRISMSHIIRCCGGVVSRHASLHVLLLLVGEPNAAWPSHHIVVSCIKSISSLLIQNNLTLWTCCRVISFHLMRV